MTVNSLVERNKGTCLDLEWVSHMDCKVTAAQCLFFCHLQANDPSPLILPLSCSKIVSLVTIPSWKGVYKPSSKSPKAHSSHNHICSPWLRAHPFLMQTSTQHFNFYICLSSTCQKMLQVMMKNCHLLEPSGRLTMTAQTLTTQYSLVLLAP